MPVENVLIVGGGIAGLAASIALGRRGVRTTVLERGVGAVGASIAITERAVYALDELGILERVSEQGMPLSAREEVDGRGVYTPDGRRLSATAPEHDDDWTLPVTVRVYRPLLSEVMRAAATEHGAEVLMGHSYSSVQAHDDVVVAELTTGERREFDLLIAADGVTSGLRAQFFPEFAQPNYTGSMSFRVMIEDAPADWRSGLHVSNGNTIVTNMLPGSFFYLGMPNHMERRHVGQDEALEIVRTVLTEYRPSKMWDEVNDRLYDGMPVIVAPYEWIFVETPWHRGRVVLVGDAAHATAPTIGSAGGMALEDGVVMAQELARADHLEAALTAYSARRRDRAKLVVETSATLMQSHQQRRPPQEEAAIRLGALKQLTAPY